MAVPNFEAICDYYSRTRKLEDVRGLLYGGQNHPLNSHTTTFDEEYLKGCLEKVGFKDVRWWDWRYTEHSEYDDYSQCFLPHMNKESGMLMSLNLEATK